METGFVVCDGAGWPKGSVTVRAKSDRALLEALREAGLLPEWARGALDLLAVDYAGGHRLRVCDAFGEVLLTCSRVAS